MQPWSLRDDEQVEQGRRRHAADGAGDRQRSRAAAGEPADGELTLDLEPHDQKEHAEQRVVDPLPQRQCKARVAEAETERPLPECLHRRPDRRIDEDDGEDGREQQQRAG